MVDLILKKKNKKNRIMLLQNYWRIVFYKLFENFYFNRPFNVQNMYIISYLYLRDGDMYNGRVYQCAMLDEYIKKLLFVR